jgi:hypothetical protein
MEKTMMERLLPPPAVARERDRVLNLAVAFNLACREGRIPLKYQTPDIHLITTAFAEVLGRPFQLAHGTVLNVHRKKKVTFPGTLIGKLYWKKESFESSDSGFGNSDNAELRINEIYHSWLCIYGPDGNRLEDDYWIHLRPRGAIPDLLSPSTFCSHPARPAYEEAPLPTSLVPHRGSLEELVGILKSLLLKKT